MIKHGAVFWGLKIYIYRKQYINEYKKYNKENYNENTLLHTDISLSTISVKSE
jgi:hypothetical protein